MQCQRTLARLTLFGAALLFVLVLPQTSRAQSKDRVGVVERLQGDVSIVHSGNSAKATEGMAISLKDQLVTGADARLQIMLADDTQITLGENAKAVIKEYQFTPFSSGNKGVVLVEVSKGAFLFTTGRISQLDGARQPHGQGHGVLGRADGRGHRRRGRVRGQRRREQRGGRGRALRQGCHAVPRPVPDTSLRHAFKIIHRSHRHDAHPRSRPEPGGHLAAGEDGSCRGCGHIQKRDSS